MTTTSGQQKPKLMVENISCVIPLADNIGGLYVGNTYGAQNADILKQYGIRAVLTTSIQTPITYDPADVPFHLKIQAHDKKDYQIIEHLNQCMEFIHKFRQVTNVYVHCYAGVSRSVTIVVAYLMKFWKWNLKTALSFVQSKRIVAKPNDGFMDQLKKFQQIIFPQHRPTTSYVLNPHLNMNQHSHQHIGYTQGHTSKQQVKKQPQFINPISITKKHSQTPIPRILTKPNNQRKQQNYPHSQYGNIHQKYHSNSTSRPHMKMTPTTQQNLNNVNPHSLQNNSQNNLQNIKSAKVLIRPKDLPGYKS